MTICSECEGKKIISCPTCDGAGNKYFVPVLDIWESDCTECYGSGVVTCTMCNGLGYSAIAPPACSDMRFLSR